MVRVVSYLVVTAERENKVNSYFIQLKFSWECKFGVEFDNKTKVESVKLGCLLKSLIFDVLLSNLSSV